jgi:hypothetical protein
VSAGIGILELKITGENRITTGEKIIAVKTANLLMRVFIIVL